MRILKIIAPVPAVASHGVKRVGIQFFHMLCGFEGFCLGAEQFVLALQFFFLKPFLRGTEL